MRLLMIDLLRCIASTDHNHSDFVGRGRYAGAIQNWLEAREHCCITGLQRWQHVPSGHCCYDSLGRTLLVMALTQRLFNCGLEDENRSLTTGATAASQVERKPMEAADVAFDTRQ